LLRLISTPYGGIPVENGWRIRQYDEGFSTANFSADHGRATDNPPLPGAPTILLVGDSHVEALQVEDRETMGSLLERDLRRDGVPVNLIQYGWGGGDAPYYAGKAREIIEKWKPSKVIVLLNRGDLDHNAAEQGAAVDSAQPEMKGLFRTTLSLISHHSTLVFLAYKRWKQMPSITIKSMMPGSGGGHAPARSSHPSFKSTAETSIRLLKNAFPTLLVVYDPERNQKDNENSILIEESLLDACIRQNVQCLTLRSVLTAERFALGFSNTLPNKGHYNVVGHRLIAEAILPVLERPAVAVN